MQMQLGNQSAPKLNITLDKTTAVVCEECNGQIFTEGLMIRKASKFLTGTQQDAIVPIPVFACAKCGHVNSDFLPKDLHGDKDA